ncbi:MAG: hypothetical protein JWN14_4721 [Chthonomonadales bacterium]|nr:hypothetical protein [Chthonomonadales bacterium]
MQSSQSPHHTLPSVVRLSPVATLIVLGVRLVFVGLRCVFNLWVALTPDQDREWKASRAGV